MTAPPQAPARRDRPSRGAVLYALGPGGALFVLALVVALVAGTVIIDRTSRRSPPPAATVAVAAKLQPPAEAAPAEPAPVSATAPARPVPATAGASVTVLRGTALHAEPAADSPVLARLGAGDTVELLAPTSVTGYFRVRNGDAAGWVWYHDISPGAPGPRQQRR